ncbi:MAG: hypothetical protein K0S41_3122 [Anaerocolumna sp.]|jgi:hypothetical protein|nr:hypothetical protein [Anaerocolumna sp.]
MKSIEQVKTEYLNYLDDKLQVSNKIITNLNVDGKNDEANLEKIRYNVYGIFKTLLLATEKKIQGKSKLASEIADEFHKEYLATFDKIPTNWTQNFNKAKEHGNTTEMITEEIKLAVVDELRESYITMIHE